MVPVILDVGGSVFSFLQLIIDSSLQADWTGLYGNPVKLGLANVSLLADFVFVLQHFVLYRHVKRVDKVRRIDGGGSATESDPLLRDR